jgi:adenylate cyclase
LGATAARRRRPGERAPDIRRRVLNAALVTGILSLAGWLGAGAVFLVQSVLMTELGFRENARLFLGIVLVGGPVASSIAFLVGEFYWRVQIPRFFPHGRLDSEGVYRLPIRMRLAATFLLTAVVPVVLMLLAVVSVGWRFGVDEQVAWQALLRAELYLALATGLASMVMALLVARFIHRPVAALREGMARVEDGDLDVLVPVRSLDELGELVERFNDMVAELRRAARTREVFGRYVSPVVAQRALEAGVELGGQEVRATAMFADLRGFTAMTSRLTPAAMVEVLNAYYAAVDRVCEREGGVITQFLGDGVVVVFGAPLQPLADHAAAALRAARALRREMAVPSGRSPLDVGIGICTGGMIAGNVGAGTRISYTIVGDAVNQAARLQVLTRDLGMPVLLTASTRDALDPATRAALRPCGAVPLKGIRAPVEVYGVVD